MRGVLLFDVLFNYGQRRTATAQNAVRPAPEYRLLPIHLVQMFLEVASDQATADGLKIVHEHRWSDFRVERQQQVHMIRFTVELNQFAIPFFRQLGANRFESFEHWRSDTFSPVLCDEN